MAPARSAEPADTEALPQLSAAESGRTTRPTAAQVERFHVLYREHFDFVFRNLRRLGVPSAQLDDAVQDAFLVALRHIDKYEAGSHGKAWLFAIALRVARNYRRTQQRKSSGLVPLQEDGTADRSGEAEPFDQIAKAEAARVLHAFLDSIDEDKRTAFIMMELEQMSAPEIAAALDVNLNTVYARVRAARQAFGRAIEKLGDRGSE
jgi:RNA polymerase sigma-70 factor (ECF subfamily)